MKNEKKLSELEAKYSKLFNEIGEKFESLTLVAQEINDISDGKTVEALETSGMLFNSYNGDMAVGGCCGNVDITMGTLIQSMERSEDFMLLISDCVVAMMAEDPRLREAMFHASSLNIADPGDGSLSKLTPKTQA